MNHFGLAGNDTAYSVVLLWCCGARSPTFARVMPHLSPSHTHTHTHTHTYAPPLPPSLLSRYGPEHAAAMRDDAGIRDISSGFIFIRKLGPSSASPSSSSFSSSSTSSPTPSSSSLPPPRQQGGPQGGPQEGGQCANGKKPSDGRHTFAVESMHGDAWDEINRPLLRALRRRLTAAGAPTVC